MKRIQCFDRLPERVRWPIFLARDYLFLVLDPAQEEETYGVDLQSS